MRQPSPSTRVTKKGSERRAKVNRPPPMGDARGTKPLFPIVGIGASAGGLEALDLFLRHVPADSGVAFVIVQHLEPTHRSSMVELLQRATAMKVPQARDCTSVQPACVYVIPPNKDMSILHGVLFLLDRVAPHGLRLPIDFFFRSLRTLENMIDGVVITFVDITVPKTLEAELRKTQAGLPKQIRGPAPETGAARTSRRGAEITPRSEETMMTSP